MQLEQNQQPTIVQTIKMKLVYSLSVVILIVVTASLIFSSPIKNFIRTYRPIPSSALHHTK